MRVFLSLTLLGLLFSGNAQAVSAEDAKPGEITVQVTGTLANILFLMGEQDDSPRLASVSVRAANREIPLDCSRCVSARRELIRRFANPGSTAIAFPSITVTGRMEFRESNKKEMVPVIVVETLKIGPPSFEK